MREVKFGRKTVFTDVGCFDTPNIRPGDIVRITYDTPYKLRSGWNPIVIFGRVTYFGQRHSSFLALDIRTPSGVIPLTVLHDMVFEVFGRKSA